MAGKFDLHQVVTDKIVAAIEEAQTNGTPLPWVRPWATTGAPRNGNSGRAYRGVNSWLLAISGAMYGSQEWFTYKGAQKLGGSVRKGEKGTLVVFWKFIKKEDKATGKETTFPLLRYFNVFNRMQCDGMPEVPAETVREFTPDQEAERLIKGSGANIVHGGDRAFYRPSADQITLPQPETFTDDGAYYATAFHELIHWTGAENRMNRPLLNMFGTPAYAEEELVAELGAAFLCAETGIHGKTQHPEYIAGWLKKLKNDKKFIFTASSAATKAVTFLRPEEDTGEDDGE